jgi:hypothetical protein
VNTVPTTGSSLDQPAPARPGVITLQRIRLAAAISWTLAIMALCWMSPRLVHELEHSSSVFELPDLDKAIHWAIFCIFALLWLRVSGSSHRYWLVALGGLALAVITEWVQSLPIVHRDGNIPDAVADVIGVVIGLAVARTVEPLLRAIESRLFRKVVS